MALANASVLYAHAVSSGNGAERLQGKGAPRWCAPSAGGYRSGRRGSCRRAHHRGGHSQRTLRPHKNLSERPWATTKARKGNVRQVNGGKGGSEDEVWSQEGTANEGSWASQAKGSGVRADAQHEAGQAASGGVGSAYKTCGWDPRRAGCAKGQGRRAPGLASCPGCAQRARTVQDRIQSTGPIANVYR